MKNSKSKCAFQCWHIPGTIWNAHWELPFSTNLWLHRAEINSPCSQAGWESGWTPKPTPCSQCSSPKSQLGNPEISEWGKKNPSRVILAGKKSSKTKPDLVCWSFAKALLLHRAGLFRRPGSEQMPPDSSIWCHTGVRDKAKLCWDQCALRGIFNYVLSHFLMAVRSSAEILSLLEPLFPRE